MCSKYKIYTNNRKLEKEELGCSSVVERKWCKACKSGFQINLYFIVPVFCDKVKELNM